MSDQPEAAERRTELYSDELREVASILDAMENFFGKAVYAEGKLRVYCTGNEMESIGVIDHADVGWAFFPNTPATDAEPTE